VRLDLTQLLGADPPQAGHLVRPPPAVELLEGGQLALLGGDDHLSTPLGADPARLAVLVKRARAFDAEPRLQGAGTVVDAGVDHAARVTGLMRADPRLALQHRDLRTGVTEGQLPRRGDPDDPRPDHEEIALRGWIVRRFQAA
jgi:hypothetical protein